VATATKVGGGGLPCPGTEPGPGDQDECAHGCLLSIDASGDRALSPTQCQ
jgi:hypothetical protein